MTWVRRDVWTLTSETAPWDPITQAYARAVKTMQARPATDPTSWTFQAAIHGSYSPAPPGAKWNECQHANWYFLPWHRMYLYYFERIVRAAVVENGDDATLDAEFGLPYWNYDQAAPRNTLPLPFRPATPLPPGMTSNPLNPGPGRRRASINNGAQLSPLITSPAAAMALTTFSGPPGAGFGGPVSEPVQFNGGPGALEQTPHNVIHVQVGGNNNPPCLAGLMIDPGCAALDPIFWLHHANIDRLWNNWIALGGGRANPTDTAWLDQAFTLYDETGTEVTLTCAEVLDTATQLDYVYDDEPIEPAVVMPTPPPPPSESARSPRPPQLVAATDTPVTLVGQPASVTLSVPTSTRERVARESVAAAAAASGGQSAIYLNVEDIDAPKNPGVVYGVFLNVPGGAPSGREAGRAEARAKYHVGNITLFGIEAVNNPDAERHGVPGLRHTFDITKVAAELSAAGNWNPDAIEVTFEPITPVDEGAQESAALGRETATPVKIGRVSLFMA
jgi:Common central domain of tyrosinase/Polyphenol oxidase middle domain